MKKSLSNQSISEILLYLYFSDRKKICLGDRIIEMLDAFISFYETEDAFNNTNNAILIREVYAISSYENRRDLLRKIGLSETALYRFRCKIVERLEKYLDNAQHA